MLAIGIGSGAGIIDTPSREAAGQPRPRGIDSCIRDACSKQAPGKGSDALGRCIGRRPAAFPLSSPVPLHACRTGLPAHMSLIDPVEWLRRAFILVHFDTRLHDHRGHDRGPYRVQARPVIFPTAEASTIGAIQSGAARPLRCRPCAGAACPARARPGGLSEQAVEPVAVQPPAAGSPGCPVPWVVRSPVGRGSPWFGPIVVRVPSWFRAHRGSGPIVVRVHPAVNGSGSEVAVPSDHPVFFPFPLPGPSCPA